MAEVPISNRVDVVVSLGTQPISTASFDSAVFVADLLDADFSDAYRVYTSLTEMVSDGFETTDKAYKFAALVFGGKFPARSLSVVKYGATNATPLTAVQALTGFFEVSQDGYFVGCDSHVDANVTAVAAYCESIDRIYVNATQQAGVLVPATTTDIGSVLQDASYDHVITLFNASADTSLAEGGIVGAMAAIPAGVSTLEDKTLVGVTVDNLNATQRSALEAKNVAYYVTIAGVNSVFNSKVASGQYLDTIIFSDWLKARLGEEIYSLMKRESDLGRKVSYDRAGIAKVTQACHKVIEQGLSNGSISNDVTPIVRAPSREEVSEAQRTARVLPDVVVEVLYSNAVHKVQVRAYVTV